MGGGAGERADAGGARTSFVPKVWLEVCCLRKPSFGCFGAYCPGPGTVLIRVPPPSSPAGKRSTVEPNVSFALAFCFPPVVQSLFERGLYCHGGGTVSFCLPTLVETRVGADLVKRWTPEAKAEFNDWVDRKGWRTKEKIILS